MANIQQLTDFWSSSSTVYAVMKMDITDTLSADASAVLWVGISGTPTFQVRKDGLALSTGHIKVVSPGTAEEPAIAWGDGDTGFYEVSPDVVGVAHAGVATFVWSATQLGGVLAGAGSLAAIASSATVPALTFTGDEDTGIGRGGEDLAHLIGGGLDCLAFAEVGAAPRLGFFGTTPIDKPTGVAVTAAGLHAALINLGIFGA